MFAGGSFSVGLSIPQHILCRAVWRAGAFILSDLTQECSPVSWSAAAGRLPVSSVDHFWSSAEIGHTLRSGRKAVVSMGYYFAPHTIKGGQAVWEDVRQHAIVPILVLAVDRLAII